MSTKTGLQLNYDHFGGFFGFLDAASREYGEERAYSGVESCQAKEWTVLREIFLNDPNKPLFADTAATLERAIRSYKPKR
jgi:hypothetical protein